jgi:hypothetical protein
LLDLKRPPATQKRKAVQAFSSFVHHRPADRVDRCGRSLQVTPKLLSKISMSEVRSKRQPRFVLEVPMSQASKDFLVIVAALTGVIALGFAAAGKLDRWPTMRIVGKIARWALIVVAVLGIAHGLWTDAGPKTRTTIMWVSIAIGVAIVLARVPQHIYNACAYAVGAAGGVSWVSNEMGTNAGLAATAALGVFLAFYVLDQIGELRIQLRDTERTLSSHARASALRTPEVREHDGAA